jgi:DNA-binding response OmpR family regulator
MPDFQQANFNRLAEDPEVRTEYQRIGQLRKSSATNQASGKLEPSKTDILLRVLQEHGERGLTLDEIMELLEPYGLNVDRNVVCTMLNRLKTKRRLVGKEGKRYFLTELGKSMKLDNTRSEE